MGFVCWFLKENNFHGLLVSTSLPTKLTEDKLFPFSLKPQILWGSSSLLYVFIHHTSLCNLIIVGAHPIIQLSTPFKWFNAGGLVHVLCNLIIVGAHPIIQLSTQFKWFNAGGLVHVLCNLIIVGAHPTPFKWWQPHAGFCPGVVTKPRLGSALIFVSLCPKTTILMTTFRPPEGCCFLEMMKGDQRLTKLLQSLFGVHSAMHIMHPTIRYI